ncbi:MAG: DegT/DnrJ/EryC1/StrS family aminotransferase [Gammaproteobacteria bacterium]|jgi:dTDP-4-amino-4,6-dideoxygalactose transaminase
MIYLAQPDISSKEKQAVLDVLDSGILASGPKVREFEQKFADYCNVEHAIAVSSGTTALHTALLGLGIGEGDRILTTPFSFIATSNSILFCNAEPVFVDIDSKTFNLDPNLVEDKLKQEKIKAIILVHLYGLPCDMDAFNFLAKKYNVELIEDSAQAVGAGYKNKITGGMSKVGCFSLYATKNLMTGEGGMITTNDDRLAEKMRSLINHGRQGHFEHTMLGFNFRMTDIAAALGIVQLERLPEFMQKRKANADFYNQHFDKIDWITVPHVSADCQHVYHQYVIRVPSNMRNKLIEYLDKNQIKAAPTYPTIIPEQLFYQSKSYGDFPAAKRASQEVVCLPVHPKLSRQNLIKVIDVISRFNL